MIRHYLENIEFDLPWVLGLLVLMPLLAWIYSRLAKRNQPAMLISSSASIPKRTSWRKNLRGLGDWLKWLALAAIVVALARPSRYERLEINEGAGIDIMLCLDVSGSMLARDFSPNRLQASIQVAKEFVRQRKGDRIGLVIFAGQSLGLAPLTTDNQAVWMQLDKLNYGLLQDGTAIGSGLASAVDKLSASETASRVIILLTDGENTGGMDPAHAKLIAIDNNVTVYTIAMGTTGFADMPYRRQDGRTVYRQEKVSIDERLLGDIAVSTGGQYFRATDTKALQKIYEDINQLEKSKVETRFFTKRTDEFFPWIKGAMILLVLAVTWEVLVVRRLL